MQEAMTAQLQLLAIDDSQVAEDAVRQVRGCVCAREGVNLFAVGRLLRCAALMPTGVHI